MFTTLLAILSGCVHVPPPSHPRPALPLPPLIAQRYAISAPVVERSLVPLGTYGAAAIYRGQLTCGDELVDFHLIQQPGDTPHSLVLCLPILAGGRELMWYVATSLADRGHTVAWTRRVASALKPGQRTAEIEALFRRTVVHNRMLLAWARTQEHIDRNRMACLGISAGGIVAGVLLAVEPDLCAGALCLAGGDLPRLLEVSAEDRAQSWRAWRRRADGLDRYGVVDELSRDLVSDPALLGPFVPTEKVLLVSATFDAVVPRRFQDVLWESLGRPERKLLPLGHFTSVLGFSSILDSVNRFVQQRFGPVADAPPPAS